MAPKRRYKLVRGRWRLQRRFEEGFAIGACQHHVFVLVDPLLLALAGSFMAIGGNWRRLVSSCHK